MTVSIKEKSNQKSEQQISRVPQKIKGGKLYAFNKRIFDFFSSLIMICLLSWLLLILFILQLFATKGHPIFADKRVGKKGKLIKVYKFRSMYYDAESNIDKYLSTEQKEIWLRERKLDNDPRITKLGKILRKTSLDELPQLFNILFGSMSVVGPRPISVKELDNFNDEELNVLYTAKPGLTGYWQVYGRSDVDFESGERQRLELEYFGKRSFWFDLGLIFKTIPAVLASKGAK
ncbi:MAG: sugar transferase [Bacilli bacterium]